MSIIGSNILAGASGQGAAGYEIERSLRFSSADSAYLSRTPASAGNRKTWTWAGWVKRSNISGEVPLFFSTGTTDSTFFRIYIQTTHELVVSTFNSSTVGLRTIQELRDPSAWMHIQVALDTTQATDSDRIKVYINGSRLEVGDFDLTNWPSLNGEYGINDSGRSHYIGRRDSGTNYANAYLADIFFVDGQALDPTSFGEFDDNGVWQPITYAGTYRSDPFYSLYATNPSSFNGSAHNLFDGDLTTSWQNTDTSGNTYASVDLTQGGATSGVSFATSFEMYGAFSYDQVLEIDHAGGTHTYTGNPGGSGAWVDFTSNLTSPVTAVRFKDSGGTGTPSWNAIRVDNTILIESGANSFHLDFADNSSAAALGYDAAGSNDWTVNNLTVDALFYGVFDGTNSRYLRKSGSGVLTSDGDVTIECHFYPLTSSTIGLFDGGPTEYDIIRNYPANTIEQQAGNSIGFSASANQWHHIAVTISSGTLRVYLDGTDTGNTSIGTYAGGSNFDIGTINGGSDGKFNGFIRNFRVTKSVVYTSNFTAPDVSTSLTAITNTSLLTLVTDFTDGSANAYSLTNNGVLAVETDSLRDSPTNGDTADDTGAGGEVPGNYCTWNPLAREASRFTFANGNLNVSGNAQNYGVCGTLFVGNSGKYYFELTSNASVTYPVLGVVSAEAVANDMVDGSIANGLELGGPVYGFMPGYGPNLMTQTTTSSWSGVSASTPAAGDVYGVAVDFDNGAIYFAKNGTWLGSGDPTSGSSKTGAAFTSIAAGEYTPLLHDLGSTDNINFDLNAGARQFSYSAPSGFKALCTANLPTPTIEDGSAYMDVALYSGNGTTQTISGLSFSPDLVWVKVRGPSSSSHRLTDKVRGDGYSLFSNLTNAEDFQNASGYISALNNDGFTVVGGTGTNAASNTYVGWAWDAGSSTVSNTDGSITSSVRANPSAGFSIVTYTGTGSAGTVGHGLNAAPGLIIAKDRDDTYNWQVYHSIFAGTSSSLVLNESWATDTGAGSVWNSTAPTSTVFSIGAGVGINTLDDTYVAYCIAPVAGYSAIGSYTGNGSSDGPFVYTGFKVKFLLAKRAVGGNGDWILQDTTRTPANGTGDNNTLVANVSNSEDGYYTAGQVGIDYLSNGFKLRHSGGPLNDSGSTYIYYAVAENPFSIARAR